MSLVALKTFCQLIIHAKLYFEVLSVKKLITLTISSFMRGFIRQFLTFVYIETSAEKYAETDQSVLILFMVSSNDFKESFW